MEFIVAFFFVARNKVKQKDLVGICSLQWGIQIGKPSIMSRSEDSKLRNDILAIESEPIQTTNNKV